MKCPCKECVLLAICVNSKGIISLLKKCHMIRDYIQTESNLETAIETLSLDYSKEALHGLVPLAAAISAIYNKYEEIW